MFINKSIYKGLIYTALVARTYLLDEINIQQPLFIYSKTAI